MVQKGGGGGGRGGGTVKKSGAVGGGSAKLQQRAVERMKPAACTVCVRQPHAHASCFCLYWQSEPTQSTAAAPACVLEWLLLLLLLLGRAQEALALAKGT